MKLPLRNCLFNYLTLATVLLFFIAATWYFLQSGEPFTFWTWTGLGLSAVSAVLFTMARLQLGGSFQASAWAHRLVTTGIYSKIRHPVYLFGFTFLLGIILVTQNFWLLIPCAAIIPMQLKRIRNEEKVLEEKFGEEYLEYKKRTWF